MVVEAMARMMAAAPMVAVAPMVAAAPMVAVARMVAVAPMAAAALLAFGSACAAKPPEPLEPLEPARPVGAIPPTERRITRATTSVPRPDIDISGYVPDIHHELRWPLPGMSHPALEPRFPIAQELALDVDWQQLCARGVHARASVTQKELLSYLGAWCDVLERDVDNACARLKPLLTSTRRGLATAVRHDLANILVSEGDADKAEHWISRHDIRDVHTLDLLAASFAETGMHDDAFVINRRAIDSDAHASDATKCRRLVKRIVISHEAVDPKFPTEELRVLARARVPDPVCRRLYNAVTCHQNPAAGCWGYLKDENIDERANALLRLYYTWPRFADSLKWWRIGDDARHALPLPGAAELSITAFEASLAADSRCTHDRAFEVHLAVAEIRKDPANAVLEPRLAQLAAACTVPALPTTMPANTPKTAP